MLIYTMSSTLSTNSSDRPANPLFGRIGDLLSSQTEGLATTILKNSQMVPRAALPPALLDGIDKRKLLALSLLNCKPLLKDFVYNGQLLAHVLGDSFIKDTSFEGIAQSEAIGYLQKALQVLIDAGAPFSSEEIAALKKVLPQLEELKRWSLLLDSVINEKGLIDYVNRLAGEMQKLAVGSRFCCQEAGQLRKACQAIRCSISLRGSQETSIPCE